jgi:hypothetical protein
MTDLGWTTSVAAGFSFIWILIESRLDPPHGDLRGRRLSLSLIGVKAVAVAYAGTQWIWPTSHAWSAAVTLVIFLVFLAPETTVCRTLVPLGSPRGAYWLARFGSPKWTLMAAYARGNSILFVGANSAVLFKPEFDR